MTAATCYSILKRRRLSARQFLGHVQKKLAVLFVDPGEKSPYFLVETQFLFLICVQNQLCGRLALAQVRQGGWLVPFIEQLVKGKFERRRQPLEGFERRNGVSVIDPRDVAAQ